MSRFELISTTTLLLSLAACSHKGEVSLNAGGSTEGETAEVEAPAAPEDPSDVHVEGDHLTIDQKIHFAHDSDEIMADSFELLDHIATALKNHTELTTVHVIGHTDSSGDKDHNQDLSERRAASVVAALKERGVTQELDSKGMGETEHMCEEDSDECHERNRRVEFLVERADS